MEFGDTGEHGQAAARAVMAAKRFVFENVIILFQIMMAKYVQDQTKIVVLVINSHAQVTKLFLSLALAHFLRHCILKCM